jgi:predicted  nucleic acid-binding Zn-ribbon protein
MSAQVAIAKLEEYASELDKRSSELSDTQRELDEKEPQYEDFIRDFEVDLYELALKDQTRLPSADLRKQLALKAMPSGFRSEYEALVRKRERLRKRIADLKAAVDAQRSVLSAEKVAMEAGGA